MYVKVLLALLNVIIFNDADFFLYVWLWFIDE
jgi:hypothetical protein